MISFITGVPGSGKTYFAVNEIHKYLVKPNYTFFQKQLKKLNLIKSEFGKYDIVYTNINEFRFDLMQSKSKELIFFNKSNEKDNEICFFDKLVILHNLYLSNVTDKELIEKAKELNLYKALIVVDEAHSYFDKQNDTLIWWLTYHRHLYQELIFITQNLSLVNSKYKIICEVFIRAHSSSLKLNKSIFPYSIFMDSRMSQKSKVGKKKLKFNKDVFTLYHSGDETKADNVILKFLIYAFIAFLIFVLGLYFFTNSKIPNEPPKTQKQNMSPRVDNSSNIPRAEKKSIPDFNINDFSYISIRCLSGMCNYNKQNIPETVIKFAIQKTNSKILEVKNNTKLKIKYLHCFVNESFKNQFNRSSPDEKNNNSPLDFFNR